MRAFVPTQLRCGWQSATRMPLLRAPAFPLLQVEGSLSRCCFRIAGIVVGSLLAFATGLSGSALNNPYYITAMASLLVAVFSLAHPVAEFRWVFELGPCCCWGAACGAQVGGCSGVRAT